MLIQLLFYRVLKWALAARRGSHSLPLPPPRAQRHRRLLTARSLRARRLLVAHPPPARCVPVARSLRVRRPFVARLTLGCCTSATGSLCAHRPFVACPSPVRCAPATRSLRARRPLVARPSLVRCVFVVALKRQVHAQRERAYAGFPGTLSARVPAVWRLCNHH